jgi:N-acetylmuramoyl-L-alanine amidase
MWGAADTIYDLIYFVLRNLKDFRWEALIGYSLYLFGKRSGMKMFRKFMTGHFPYLADENEDWRRWATNQIELLGGRKWQPTKQYGRMKRSARVVQKSLTISLALSLEDTLREGVLKMAKKKVKIDPGHGGHDSGAISVTGVKEKDINLATALKVAELLKPNPNIECTLTRTTDVFIELSERAKMANKEKADAFISIHVNSFKDTSAGTETEYTRTGESEKLAQIVQKHLVKATGFKDRGINKYNLAVTRETTMAAALTEPGYLSNPAEELILVSPDFIPRYAEAVARGVCEYLGIQYEAVPSNTNPVTVRIGALDIEQPGIIIDGRSWVPAKLTLGMLGFLQWTFSNKTILINGVPVETKIFNSTSYIRSVDLMTLGLVRSVFMEPDASNPKRVLIIPKEG